MPIFDASSIQAALRKLRGDAALLLEGQAALDLTLYELGNIVWKESRATGGDPGEAADKAKAISRLLSIMEIRRIEIGEMAAIAENATKHGLTFYDSAYLTTALTAGTSLVTEDQDILRAAHNTGLKASPIDEYMKTSS